MEFITFPSLTKHWLANRIGDLLQKGSLVKTNCIREVK